MTIFSLGLFTTVEPALAQSELDGAWEIVEASGHNANGEWKNESVQPSLYLFHNNYFSRLLVRGDEERPLFEEGESIETVSVEKLRANYSLFGANAGTYEINGSSIIFHRMIAKHPNNMTAPYTRGFRLENDALYLSGESQNGSVHWTYTLQRLK